MIHPRTTLQLRELFDPVRERPSWNQLYLSPTGADWRVNRLLHFIDTGQGKLGWSLNRVCEQLELGVSGSHGAKLFKKHIGIGIREYAKRRRLVVAAEKLKATTLSVKEIAADLGYTKQTDFRRQFKQLFSINPTEFRSAHRQAANQDTHCPESAISVRKISFLKRRVAQG